MKKIFFSLLVLVLPFIAAAQPKGMEDIEAIKVSWITQKLDLSVEDAKIFWPIYNDYTKEQNNLRNERRMKMISFRKTSEIDELSDTQVQLLITSELDLKQRELNIDKKYYAKFKAALPIKTLAKFYRAQETFKKELLDRYRGNGPGGPGRKQ